MNVFMGYNPTVAKQVKVTVWVKEIDGAEPIFPATPNDGDCFIVFDTDDDVLANSPSSKKSYANGSWGDVGGGGGGGGDSDFTTATLTTLNLMERIYIPNILYDPEHDLEGSCGTSELTSNPYTVILYKGKAYFQFDPSQIERVLGNITFDENLNVYVITGDCYIQGKALY